MGGYQRFSYLIFLDLIATILLGVWTLPVYDVGDRDDWKVNTLERAKRVEMLPCCCGKTIVDGEAANIELESVRYRKGPTGH